MCITLHNAWLQCNRTHVQAWRVGARVAEPHVKAGIVCCKGVAAGYAIAHPAHGRVEDSVHEKHHVASACKHQAAGLHMQVYADMRGRKGGFGQGPIWLNSQIGSKTSHSQSLYIITHADPLRKQLLDSRLIW